MMNDTATDDENIALGLGLSLGLYVLICVLIPVLVYIVVVCLRSDVFNRYFYAEEYPRTAGSRSTIKKTAETTVSLELGVQASDYPPVYPMTKQLNPATLASHSSDAATYQPHATNGSSSVKSSAHISSSSSITKSSAHISSSSSVKSTVDTSAATVKSDSATTSATVEEDLSNNASTS